jgi:hypothetical protein
MSKILAEAPLVLRAIVHISELEHFTLAISLKILKKNTDRVKVHRNWLLSSIISFHSFLERRKKKKKGDAKKHAKMPNIDQK